jgi:hypothetical protein
MHTALMLAVVPLFPLGCLGLLLYLAWLEDRLDADMKKASRRPSPEPIRAIPVHSAPVNTAPALAAPVVARAEVPRRPVAVPAPKPAAARSMPAAARSMSAAQAVDSGRLPAVS